MMRIKKQILFCLMLGWMGALQAQDIHYSMYDMAPINLNAAYTGYFNGTLRIGGIYRSQWPGMGLSNSSGTSTFKGYSTPAAYIDVPIGFGKREPMRSWLGVGLSFLNDKVGVGDLSTLNGMLSLAYHLGLGAKGNTRISFGLKGGIMSQRIDASKLQFETGMNSGQPYTQVGDNTPASNSASFADFSGGLMISHVGTKFGVEAGFAINHFLRPKYNFLGAKSQLPMGLTGSAIFRIGLTERLFLRPMAFYQFMNKAQEINAQVLLGIHFNDAKDITFLVGGGYRVGDAAIGRVGLELKGLRFGFAYDFNANKLSNNGRAQGFEVALSYIAKLYKNPVIKPILFCPRF